MYRILFHYVTFKALDEISGLIVEDTGNDSVASRILSTNKHKEENAPNNDPEVYAETREPEEDKQVNRPERRVATKDNAGLVFAKLGGKNGFDVGKFVRTVDGEKAEQQKQQV
jgi:hypothetical protein